ncbi:MAG: hypothetical protein AAGB00_02145 [Planctomycetota bacterium]
MSSGAPDANPFASPLSAAADDVAADSEFEAVRRDLIGHEASVRSMGLLYMIGFVGAALAAVGCLVAGSIALANGAGPSEGGVILGIAAGAVAFAALYYWIGMGLRRLNPQVRIPAIILSAIGLLGFPIGTLISGYFLYLLCSNKGERVMSPEYQEIIAATPHIKYKTSVIAWVFLGLFAVLVLGGVLSAVLGG